MLGWLLKIITGGVPNVVGNVVTVTAIISALSTVVIWLQHHGHEEAISLDYDTLVLFGCFAAVLLFIVWLTSPRRGG